MALLNCQFHSDVLGMATSMTVILPEDTNRQIGQTNRSGSDPWPVLYLLHGLSDDHTIWQRRTSIERFVAPLGWAVIMPTTHRGFYTDAVDGYQYFTHIAEEVPAKAEQFFRISRDPARRFIAGLSMGGYGAFKIALSQPDRWAAAASLSGVTDLAGRYREEPGDPLRRQEAERIFGPLAAIAGSCHDIHHLLQTVARQSDHKPRLFQCCGTEDFLLDGNRRTRDLAQGLDLDYRYEEGPGSHEWAFWDHWIQRVLRWLTDGNSA